MIPGIQVVFTPRCSMWQLMYARTQGWPKNVCTCTVYVCVCVCVCVGGGIQYHYFGITNLGFPSCFVLQKFTSTHKLKK